LIRFESISLSIWLLLGSGSALLIAGAIWLAMWLRVRRRKRALIERIQSVSLAHLQDVIVSDGNDGWFHLDFVLLTHRGILVLDLRDVAGMIFGGEQMTEWTVMNKQRRFTFSNPLNTLYDRLAVVRSIAGEDVPVEGRVVFSDRGQFPKGQPPSVTLLALLAETISQDTDLDSQDLVEGRLQPAWERIQRAATLSPLRRL
jgi:hypothetical protein